MEIRTQTAPISDPRVLALWSEIFGPAEAALEAPQIDGSEAEDNLDLVLTAEEGDALLGAVHLTFSRVGPALAGVSGVCTAPAARGRGIGRALMAAAAEQLDRRGVIAAVLGTGNPAAARMYQSFGFGFLPGSCVMARFAHGDALDLDRALYAPPEGVRVLPGGPGLRIPLVPLVLHRGPFRLLDCNTQLVSSLWMTQRSCMGLYPRYAALRAQGGVCFAAVSSSGVTGGVASAVPTPEGVRADLFCCESFLPAADELLAACEAALGPVHLWTADEDVEKQTLARQLGFVPGPRREAEIAGVRIPCTEYHR